MPKPMLSKELADYPDVYAFALEHLELKCSRFRGWPHAESLVWQLDALTGASFYVKVYRQARKYEQEVFAYRHFLEPLLEFVPRLVAEKPLGQRAILLTALPGKVLEGQSLKRSQQQALYTQAGALLRKLHDQSFHDQDIALDLAWQQRFKAWCLRGEAYLAKADIAWLAALLADALPHLRSYKRLPCHRDYSPRNWLVDGLRLRIIDFEHTRADLFLGDFQRLAAVYWPQAPDLEAAFWQGYGRNLNSEECYLLTVAMALEALTSIVWATEHQDEVFKAQGQKTLERLRKLNFGDLA